MSALLAAALFAVCFPATGYIVAPPVMPVHIEAAVEAPIGAEYVLTGYSCSEDQGTSACVGRWTGRRPVEGRTIASNTIPAGTVVVVEGLGRRIVEDSGGGLAADQIDLYFEAYDDAVRFGRQSRRVTIVQEENGNEQHNQVSSTRERVGPREANDDDHVHTGE